MNPCQAVAIPLYPFGAHGRNRMCPCQLRVKEKRLNILDPERGSPSKTFKEKGKTGEGSGCFLLCAKRTARENRRERFCPHGVQAAVQAAAADHARGREVFSSPFQGSF